MTCHCVFTAWDEERPASQSPIVIGEIIRGRIGFDGFLMSDDIGMHALGGGFAERARGVIEAGTDAVLHCSGVMEEMVAVASAAGELCRSGARAARAGDGEPRGSGGGTVLCGAGREKGPAAGPGLGLRLLLPPKAAAR